MAKAMTDIDTSARTNGQALAAVSAAPATSDATVFSAIERIMTDPGASVERANQAFEFYQKVQADQARKAFDAAVADAKAEIPDIVKKRTGHNSKKYADFAAFARAADPVLSRHGLHYRFRTAQANAISVTCVLSHRLGHSEENTLSGPADTTGNKNAIQAIGSTLTYLQRYTLTQALGLAASEDDDGKTAEQTVGDGPITDEQVSELIALADRWGADKAKFCRFLKVESFADIQKSKFEEAKQLLNSKRKP